MTQREFFEAVRDFEGMSEELKAKAIDLITALDNRNANRAKKPTKTQEANKPIIEAIKGLLTSEPTVASVIANKYNNEKEEEAKITTNKASALLQRMDGVKSVKVKVKGKGEQNGYFVAE